MKSRLILAAMIAVGLLFTFSGAWAVANNGFDDDDAAETQYHNRDNDREGFDSVGTSGGGGGDRTVDSGEQVGVGGGNLAFTGFAAIPLLIIGLGLLGGGAALTVKRRE